jgi:ankyrin repeat protein
MRLPIDAPKHYSASPSSFLTRLLPYRPQDREVFINQFGGDLLLWAAAWGYTRVAELLIDAGVNVDIKDVIGWAGLHLAAENCRQQMVRVLLQAKADASIRTSPTSGYTPLHIATKTSDLSVIAMLLEANAEVDDTIWSGETPLHIAVKCNNVGAVALLVAANADLDAKDKYHRTPLHMAAELGNITVIEKLLNAGCTIGVRDRWGETPLEIAFDWESKLGASRLLLDHWREKSGLGSIPVTAFEKPTLREMREYYSIYKAMVV